MDALSFTAEAIKALAWPTATVLVALMVRKPVVELLPFLKRLKYKEVELEFSKELAQLKTEAETQAKGSEIAHQTPIAISSNSRLLNLASISTSAAILEAWSELESVAIAVASAIWNQPPSDIFKNYPRLGDYLYQNKVIDEKQRAIFNKLRELRNKAAHAVDLNLSESEARTYIELAAALTSHIREGQNVA
jgi:uncharacterized protein YutE (UPF0331/DUF86 family)